MRRGFFTMRGVPAIITSYDAASEALFARFTTQPDATRKGHIDTCIRALKTAGVWAKLDGLWNIWAHDEQGGQRNWVQDAYNLTPVNSPTFTVDRGYTGNGTNAYIETNFSRTAGGTNFSRNSASFSGWSRTELAASSSRYLIGNSTAAEMFIRPRSGSNNLEVRPNTNLAGLIVASTSSVGHFSVNRSGASAAELYRDGVQVDTSTDASAALSASEFWFLRSSTFHSAYQIGFAHIGGSLTSAEQTALYDAVNAYRAAIGA